MSGVPSVQEELLAIARELDPGGETLQPSSADTKSARKLAASIWEAASIAVDNRTALLGADAVVLALRFSVLKDVIDQIGDALSETSLVVSSNPVGLDAKGEIVRLPPEGQSSGEVVASWLPTGTPFAIALGTHVGRPLRVLESSSHRLLQPAVLFWACALARHARPHQKRCREQTPQR